VLRKDFLEKISKPARWGKRLIEECQEALAIVLPFEKAELEFLNMLIDYGEIRPSLITDDRELAQSIRHHPMLNWKALNVQKYKGK